MIINCNNIDCINTQIKESNTNEGNKIYGNFLLFPNFYYIMAIIGGKMIDGAIGEAFKAKK